MDKAGQEYWDKLWEAGALPEPIDSRCSRLSNYPNRRLHERFVAAFSSRPTQGLQLLEVGCARSAWLPYFNREFGFRVAGLDYSETGCKQARQVLSDAGVEGEIVCADFFSPPEALLARFNVVVSFGVVEHFEDTAACLGALARFLQPGGLLITVIPNMAGWVGTVQKALNRPVFEIHVKLDAPILAQAQRRAGLDEIQCEYFLSTGFGVLNLNGLSSDSLSWWVKHAILASLSRLSLLIWWLEQQFGEFPANRYTSPYVICVAQKK
jgi:2-polyprenyl-3-methyl-5-hydroxy-6-metoxy-1,4-benzoquinol methylase